MNPLIERYRPRWLYLHEFAGALGQAAPHATDIEIADAIALLVRDRLIDDGKLNDREFRFLEGKPDLRTTAWLNLLEAGDFNWSESQMLAGVDTTKPGTRVSDHAGLLIEIAESCIDHFEDNKPRATREPKGKGGRRPRFNQEAVSKEVMRLMDYHGEFSDDDGWNAQARLNEAIREKFGEAAPSTVDEYIKEPLAHWRNTHPKT
jgi:hypothetical protein